MTCHDVQHQLSRFLDGMLDATTRGAVQQHLETCASCRVTVEANQRLEQRLRATLRCEAVPDTLWPRILADVSPGASAGSTKTQRLFGTRWVWSTVAAAVIVLALSVVLLKPWLLPDTLEARVLSVPVQDLHTFVVSQRNLDVASTVPEHVRHWFQEKVDFAPPHMPEHVGKAHLVGGRLCHFLNRRVAAFMYTADEHYLSLYVMPRHGLPLPTGAIAVLQRPLAGVHAVQGYTHILWSQADLLYSLVSDLPQPQLVDMARAVAQAG
jgi:anti-sigma factor RsiW